MIFAINSFHGPLEPPKQRFSSEKCRRQIDSIAQFIDIFQHLIKAFEMLHDDIAMFLENGHGDEEVEVCREVVGP